MLNSPGPAHQQDHQAKAARPDTAGSKLEARRRRAFTWLWLSEFAFDSGAALMSFALGVWVFEKTGSAEQFSWSVLATTVPALLLVPFAGALADRFDRRWVIAGCDVLAALLVAVLAAQQYWGELQLMHLYAFNAATAVVGTLRNPAFRATVSMIVPIDNLTRANGILGMSEALLQVVAPVAAGFIMASHGLGGIMVVELVLVLAGACAIFAAVSSIRWIAHGHHAVDERVHLLHECVASVRRAVHYFRSQRLMLALLAYVALQEGLLVLASTMITPLVLSTHSSEDLGLVLTSGALGGVAGAALMVLLKIKRRLMLWVLCADVVLSVAVATAGMSSSFLMWCACAFVALGAGGASVTCSSALWMRKTPTQYQGSVFAFREGIYLLATCVAMLAGGILGERLLQPALMPGGALADTVGQLVGVGPGRGYGLLFAVIGCACASASLVALTRSRVRRLDALVDDRDDDPDAAPQA